MPLKVVGAAFGRTGTKSIKLALERLGFGPCHHMFELGDNSKQTSLWQEIARGEKPEWDKVFADYQASVDWPSARYWREIAEHFSDAKVLLTIRDEDSWFDSVRRTIFPVMRDHIKMPSSPRRDRLAVAYEIIVNQTFQGRMGEREYATQIYREYVAEVRRTIVPERLLAYEVSQGWAPLCAFLEVPVPDEAFPFTNTTQQFTSRLGRLD